MIFANYLEKIIVVQNRVRLIFVNNFLKFHFGQELTKNDFDRKF